MKITMYQANDGSLHKTQALCDAKNVELRTAPLVEEFVNSLTDQSVGLTPNDENIMAVYLADLPAFLVAHADALRTLLNKAINPVGRPRKNKVDGEKPARKPRAKKVDTPATQPADGPSAEVDPLDAALAELS